MPRNDQKGFFLSPDHPMQRRDEVLRAIIVEELPLKDVAEKFGLSYGTVRNWHSQFQQDSRRGDSPPFS
jgi:transposase-like protein